MRARCFYIIFSYGKISPFVFKQFVHFFSWMRVYACASMKIRVMRACCAAASLASVVSLVRGVSISGGIVDRTGHTAPRRVLRSSWNNAEARGSERSTPLCGSWNGTNAFRANLRANSPSVHLRPGSSIAAGRSADVALRRYYRAKFLTWGKSCSVPFYKSRIYEMQRCGNIP